MGHEVGLGRYMVSVIGEVEGGKGGVCIGHREASNRETDQCGCFSNVGISYCHPHTLCV